MHHFNANIRLNFIRVKNIYKNKNFKTTKSTLSVYIMHNIDIDSLLLSKRKNLLNKIIQAIHNGFSCFTADSNL